MPSIARSAAGGKTGPKLNVFISYARADLERAQQIVAALEARGLGCTIDTRDLPYGEKWQGELRDFIKAADTVVFLVSPKSIASKWCKWEVAQVAAQSKRLVPVVLNAVPADELPPEIGEVHLFPFTVDLQFEERSGALAEVLLTDRTWIKEHTRLADRAGNWIASNRSRDHLLGGRALAEAEQWMARRPSNAPAPSQEHLDFVVASQVAAKRRGRMWVGGLTAAVVVFAAVAAAALLQREEAMQQRAVAVENERIAKDQRNRTLRGQSLFLVDLANQQLAEGDATSAMLLALEGLPDEAVGIARPYVPQLELALDLSRRKNKEKFSLKGHDDAILMAEFSSDGRRVVTASRDHTARVWDTQTGRNIAILRGHKGEVFRATFSPNGQRVLTASDDETARVWDSESGKELKILPDYPPTSAMIRSHESAKS